MKPVVVATGVLCVLAAGLGLYAGQRPSESDVIQAGAARYVAETGQPMTDCVGLPSDRAWIEVHCGTGLERRVYAFTRRGALQPLAEVPDV